MEDLPSGFQPVPDWLEQARDAGHITDETYDNMMAWFSEIKASLRRARGGRASRPAGTGRIRVALHCARAAGAFEAGSSNREEDATELGQETLKALDLHPDANLHLIHGLDAFPRTFVLRYHEPPTVLLFDSDAHSIYSPPLLPLVTHEVAHADQMVRTYSRSFNDNRAKAGEAMADCIGQALTASAFGHALHGFQEASGIPPGKLLPEHPSFAARATVLETEALELWDEPYVQEVTAPLEALAEKLRSIEEDRVAYWMQEVQHVRGRCISVKLEPEVIYEARNSGDAPETTRADLAANTPEDPP